MSIPTSDQVQSFLRHVYSGLGAATAALVLVGLSQGNATALGHGVHLIGDGIASIIAGVTALIPVASGLYAAWTASPFSRLLSMKKNTEIEKVVAVPGTATAALANSIPGDKITTGAVVKAAKAVIALFAVLVALSFAMPAMAATKKAAPAATPAATDPISSMMVKLEAANADIIKNTIAALQVNLTDAGTVVNTSTGDVKDPISAACYPAQIKFLQSLPAAQPITIPAPYNLIVLFQLKRDFVAQLKAGIPSYLVVGCSALLGNEIQTFISTMGLVGIAIAAPELTPLLPAVTMPALPALSGLIPGL